MKILIKKEWLFNFFYGIKNYLLDYNNFNDFVDYEIMGNKSDDNIVFDCFLFINSNEKIKNELSFFSENDVRNINLIVFNEFLDDLFTDLFFRLRLV